MVRGRVNIYSRQESVAISQENHVHAALIKGPNYSISTSIFAQSLSNPCSHNGVHEIEVRLVIVEYIAGDTFFSLALKYTSIYALYKIPN